MMIVLRFVVALPGNASITTVYATATYRSEHFHSHWIRDLLQEVKFKINFMLRYHHFQA